MEGGCGPLKRKEKNPEKEIMKFTFSLCNLKNVSVKLNK
jgi:hypothetical protein